MSEDALVTFNNQLKYWQRDGYFVLLNNFYNMKEKNIGFVLSVNESEKKFTFKLYVNKVLDERTYPFENVNNLISDVDKVIKS